MTNPNLAPTATLETWIGGVSGLWSSAANWSLGRAPKSGDDVEIAPGSPLTVTFDVASLYVGVMTLSGAALNLQGGALTVGGATTLQNATIEGAKSLRLFGESAVSGLTIGGSAALYNEGTVTQSGAAVAIGDTAASTAQIDNFVGASWIISDDSGMTQGSTSGWRFVNSGLFEKTDGSGTAIIEANFLSTGTIASASGGDIEFDGTITRLSGTYIGAGMVDYGPDGVSTVGPVSVTASCCQTNWGTVNLVGDMTMYDGSTIMNAGGARWNFDGDSSLVLAGGQAAGPDINGAGLIAKTSGVGVSHVGVDVEAEGGVAIATGTISFDGQASSFFGAITGAGTLQLNSASSGIASGARVGVAHWTLAGGTTTLGENLGYAGAFAGQAGATLALNGMTLTLSGSANVSGLALSGAGIMRVGSATVSSLSVGGTAKLMVGGAVTQTAQGVVTLGDAVATDAAQLTILAGGSWTLGGGSQIALGADPASAINISASASNPGALAMTGSGTAIVAPTIYNLATGTGGVRAQSGVLDLQGAVYGNGASTISGSATLEFDNKVGVSQSVVFSASDETLKLNDLADYFAGISGFDVAGSDDALLIAGGWGFSGASVSATAATLSFGNGSAHHTLTLLGDYVGGAFTAQNVSGGLKITY